MALQKEGIQVLLDQAHEIKDGDSESDLADLLGELQTVEGIKGLSTEEIIAVLEAQFILYKALFPFQENKDKAWTAQKDLDNRLKNLRDKLEQEKAVESAKNY